MGESSFGQQYRLLLWKNYKLKRRHWLATLIEILIPIFVIIILVLVRSRVQVTPMGQCFLRQKQMDSLGPLPFVADFICTFNTTCYNQTQINWNDTSPNNFQIFLTNISTIFGSFPGNNLTMPAILQWVNANPENSQSLVYSITYINTILTPLMQYLQMTVSPNQNVVTAGVNALATFICGSDQNDALLFLRYFLTNKNTTTSGSCAANFFNVFSANSLSSSIYQIVAPIVFGQIYYTPVSALTQEIVMRANRSFVILDNLRLASIEWRVNFKGWLMSQLTNPNAISLKNDSSQCMISNVPQTAFVCQQINSLLNVTSTKTTIDTLSILFSFLENNLNCMQLNKFVPVPNDTVVDNLNNAPVPTVLAGLVFDSSFQYLTRQNATLLNYTIRMPTNRIDSTTNFVVRDSFWTPNPRTNTLTNMMYYTSGFLMLQEAIDRAFIDTVSGNYTTDVGSSMQIMPTPCYVVDNFTRFASSIVPLFLIMAWFPTFILLIKGIVYEKEKRLKEFMLVMGLSNLVHWLAWFTITLLITIVPCIVTVILLKARKIFTYSNPGVVFILLFSYIVSFISQGFMLSTFFDKANISAIMALLLYFVFYMPSLILVNVQNDITSAIYFVASLLAEVSFCNAINFIAYWEQSMVGAQFNNLLQSTVLNLNFGVGHCMIMLWVDTLIHLLITWYIEAVFPGEFGIPKPWYFLFTKKYWYPSARNLNNSTIFPFNLGISENITIVNDKNDSNEAFEAVPDSLEIGISIQNLTKIFAKNGIPSVNNLNLNFYKSQITAFLGHNGAGKTTTMSMLTGIIPPTSGTAYILNKDIRTDIDIIRRTLGFCPQHNILFDTLTVEDHIYFYGLLKGMSAKEINSIIPQIAKDVGLTKKLDVQSQKLSGGMKRKLSIAMSFIGGSKVIFLDEPTAGVDPFARRGIWDLLINYRGNDITIVLTTHHMDEADYLSDRIAIISQGKLKCSGSSSFLKRQYGDGYYLNFVKDSQAQKEKFTDNLHSESGEYIYQFIRKQIRNAQFIEETKTQWNFILPLEGFENNGFSNLFKSLDESLEMFHISTYGLSDASLEDVFLKVADDPSKDKDEILEQITDHGNLPRPVSRSSIRSRSEVADFKDEELTSFVKTGNYNLIEGIPLLNQQILALQIKRFHYTKRNVKGFVAELILPALMVILVVALLTLINPMTNQPAMTIYPWLMMPKTGGVSLQTFYRKENDITTEINQVTDSYRSDLGESGVRCMNNSIYSISNLPCYSTTGNSWSAIPQGQISLTSPECDCETTGSEICSNALSGGPPFSNRVMASSDTLGNLTGYNISDNLVKNFFNNKLKLYGGYQFLLPSYFGISCKTLGNFGFWNFLLTSIQNSQANITNPLPSNFVNYFQNFLLSSGVRTNYSRIWVNTKGFVSMPAYANILGNLLLRSNVINAGNVNNYGIVVTSYPFKYSQSKLLSLASSQTYLQVSLSTFVILALSLIPASFVIFLIEERVSGSKRQQFVSGVNPYVYWMSTFFWDILKYLSSAFLIVLIFLAFSYQSYVGSKNIGAFICILTLYGFAIIPHMYPFSYIVSTPSAAFVILSGYNMGVGSLTTMTTFFLDQLANTDSTLTPINNGLKNFFMIFPQYCLGRGMLDLSVQYLQYNATNGTADYDPFSWEFTGQKLMALGILFAFWAIFILFIESGLINQKLCGMIKNHNVKQKTVDEDEDADVTSERNRVKNEVDGKDVLSVVDLTKIYNTGCGSCQKVSKDSEVRKLAVNNICFGVKAGECFGLLGVNGAGKTTTFKMLTGEEAITEGEATINKKSIIHDMVGAHRNMGFCPQFDALHALLSCEEELYFYCRLRGIETALIKSTVESSFKRLSLEPHAKKTTQTLSGGNKRKLSTAISLVGSPSVIFMDEPTSGMDAGARRFLWNEIKKLTKQQRAVILTSHNMEECEVLCHRLAIMVNGEFKCLGSVQQLKSKFGNDYYVTLRMSSTTDNIRDREKIKDIMKKEFNEGASLKDENFVSLQYRMDPSVCKLYKMFDFFEVMKTTGSIIDYSICQTTLDEIFVSFAREVKALPASSPSDIDNTSEKDNNEYENPAYVD